MRNFPYNVHADIFFIKQKTKMVVALTFRSFLFFLAELWIFICLICRLLLICCCISCYFYLLLFLFRHFFFSESEQSLLRAHRLLRVLIRTDVQQTIRARRTIMALAFFLLNFSRQSFSVYLFFFAVTEAFFFILRKKLSNNIVDANIN